MPRGRGFESPRGGTIFYTTNIGKIRGATWHPLIGPRVTLWLVCTVQSTYIQQPIQHAQSTATSLPYNHVSCHVSIHTAKSHSYPTTTSASVQPSHPATSASIQPPIICIAMCQPIIGPRHIRAATCHVRTMPRVISVLVQLRQKMPKPSDTCHLLVIPCFLLMSS
jgi:hypothetical protein